MAAARINVVAARINVVAARGNSEQRKFGRNKTRTYNHLVHKRTLNHLAKLVGLTKWLSVGLRTKWL